MKKTVLALFLLCSIGAGNAQFSQGQKAISGGIGLNTSTSESTSGPTAKQTNTSFSIAPAFTIFTSPTMMTSIGVYYSHGTNKSVSGTSSATSKADGTGVFFTRTKLNKLANRFYFTYGGTASASLGFTKNATVPATPEISSNSWIVAVGGNLGLMYQLNNRLLLSTNLNNFLSASFSHGVQKNGGVATQKNNTFNFGTGLTATPLSNFSVGVMLLLK